MLFVLMMMLIPKLLNCLLLTDPILAMVRELTYRQSLNAVHYRKLCVSIQRLFPILLPFQRLRHLILTIKYPIRKLFSDQINLKCIFSRRTHYTNFDGGHLAMHFSIIKCIRIGLAIADAFSDLIRTEVL